MAYLSNTSVNGDLGVSGLTSVGSAGLKFTSGIINIFGTSNSGGTGTHSISIGSQAAATGTYSVALGFKAQTSATETVAIGDEANTSGPNSIAIGYGAGATKDYSIAFGRSAKATNTYAVSIGPYATNATAKSIMLGGGSSYCSAVYYKGSTNNSLSDERDKTEIKELRSAISFINRLKPVTYRMNMRDEYEYTEEEISNFSEEKAEEYSKYLIDKEKYGLDIPFYNKEEHLKGTKKRDRSKIGFIAQDVEKLCNEEFGSDNYVNLINRMSYNDEDGNKRPEDYDRIYMNYEGFIPLLVKAFQEQNEYIKGLEARIDFLEKK